MQQTKADIRAMMKEREREFLASGVEVAESARILAAVEASPEFRAATVVLAYMSLPGEVRTEDFIRRWSRSKTMLLPLVAGSALELRLYGEGSTVCGYAGITEPAPDAELFEPAAVGFALIPGIAFARDAADGRVWRMGRGKGFYDRLLPRLRCPAAGICYPFRLLDGIPLDPWDRPLDAIFY